MAQSQPAISIQSDGSLVIYDSSGGVADLVKEGTPRQSVDCAGQSMNVSYGFNSAGKKTILVSLPKTSPSPADFIFSDRNVSLPPGSALRITLNSENQIERMDGTPAGTVTIAKTPMVFGARSATPNPLAEGSSAPGQLPETEALPTPTYLSTDKTNETALTQQPSGSETKQTQPMAPVKSVQPQASPLASIPQSPSAFEEPSPWPGGFLDRPIPSGKIEEDPFYIRAEGGARFVSSMSIVNITGGPNNLSNALKQKEIAFNTGYRQDIDAGVWLTDWFGLSFETGFAVNPIKQSTQGMTVSNSTYWSIPIMAQLCFQYPNDTGFLPYINLGFGGGWNYFNVGSIGYSGSTLSGSAHDLNNAYQVSAGVRCRLYEQLSLTLAYKFYGTSQPSMGLNNDLQVTFGSPVTNSVEIGGNFAF